jgi:hypothetical protein
MHETHTLETWKASGRLLPVCSLPGVTLFHIMPDTLHIVDKGVALHVLGNCIFQLIQEEPDVQGSLEARVHFVFYLLQREYEQQNTPARARIPGLTMGMVCASDARNPTAYPCLSGVKAAHVRHLVAALLPVLERLSKGTQLELHRLKVVRLLREYYEIIMTNPPVLPKPVAARLMIVVHSCICHYAFLANAYARSGKKLFLMPPKMHYWFHQAQMSRYVNPRAAWTYAGEDYVGRIARVAKSVVHGHKSTRVAQAVMRNYLTAVEVRMHRRESL